MSGKLVSKMNQIHTRPKHLQIKRFHRDAKLPTRATLGSGGLDLYACEDAVIGAGATCKFPLGFALYIEDPKMAGLIVPRSGLATKHGIVLANTVGLIDSDYQGELVAHLWNRSDNDYTVKKGDRIAQLVLIPIIEPKIEWFYVKEFNKSGRGTGGFGSTG